MLSQWANTGGSGVGGFPYAKFVLGAQSTIIPTSSGGSSTPTFTRATTATVVDFEGRLVTVPSGAARFQGARFVQNMWAISEGVVLVAGNGNSFQNGTPTITYIADPNGGTNALRYTMTVASTNTFDLVKAYISDLATFTYSLKIRGFGTAGKYILLTTVASNMAVQSVVIPLSGTTWQRYSLTAALINLTGGPKYFIRPCDAGGTVISDTVDFAIFGLQLENVTGQSNQNPSEYVSVGVLSAPYHGAGIDGAAWKSTQNGNTVASNVVTEATGAVIADATLKGYLSEGAGTQILATADIRDMTTVGWTLGATMTRARTSTGIDGVASTATRLTGGAVAATNIITTAIVAAATSRTYSAYVKRITGTGTVRISQDNFATNTDITSQLINGSWVLIQLNQTQLNAVMGFKIDTSTDAIDVDCNQFESGAFATSRMLATGAARNADVLTFASAGNISGTVGTIYAEYYSAGGAQNNFPIVTDSTSASYNGLVGYSIQTGLRVFDGTNTANGPAGAQPLTVYKIAGTWTGSVLSAYSQGTAGTPGTFDGDIGIAVIGIGTNTGVTEKSCWGTIRNIRIYNRALSAAQLAAMTT